MPKGDEPTEAGIEQINVIGDRVPEVIEVAGHVGCLKGIHFLESGPIGEEFGPGRNAQGRKRRQQRKVLFGVCFGVVGLARGKGACELASRVGSRQPKPTGEAGLQRPAFCRWQGAVRREGTRVLLFE